MNVRPPRLAEWLLERLLDRVSRDVLAGDLEEQYRRAHASRGALRARLSYWRDALRTIAVCRITGVRTADARRMDFDTGGHMSIHDLLKRAFRQFKDQPLYTLACAGTLALAVAAACASFAVVKRAFLDPLPYVDDDALVSILTLVDGRTTAVSAHVLDDLQRTNPPFAGFAPIRPAGVAFQTLDGTETATLNMVTPDFFTVLGVSPVRGRAFADNERDVAVISWRVFQRLGGDERVIGSAITLDGRSQTVIGVMPQGFVAPYFTVADFWLPINMPTLLEDVRGRRPLTVIARRAPHASQAEIEAFLAGFSRTLQQRLPRDHSNQAWVAPRLRDELVGPARPALIGTGAAALLLLLIVCANIAGLSTAHAAAIRHQIAIRAALGATRGRLFCEQLVDSIVVAAVGSVVGIWLAQGLIAIVARYQAQFLERFAPVTLDAATILAGGTAGLTVGVVAALFPRGVVSAIRPVDSLRARGGTGDTRVTVLRTSLVIVQVALALVLLVGAGLLVRTVSHLANLSMGLASDRLTTFNIGLPIARYQSQAAQVAFERRVLEELTTIPGVTATSASVGFPAAGTMGAALAIQGRQNDQLHEIAYYSVSPGFLTTTGMRLIAGRDLTADDRTESTRVVLINETMARTFWPVGDALGAQVQIGAGSPTQRWITVVGIVADVRQNGPTENIRPTAFGSTYQYSWPTRYFTVRSEGTAPVSLAMDLRAAIRRVDPALAVGTITPVDKLIGDRTARHTLVMLALGLFGTVAFALCAAGLYAVVALTSRMRRREYAIRMALGAGRGGVRWLVIRQALIVAGSGIIAGLLAAAAATRSIEGMLHGVRPIDPGTFSIAAVALLALAIAAAWLPASQAERVDPTETLKAE